MVPVALPPSVVGLIVPLDPVGPPLPGFLAVLESVALSWTAWPKLTVAATAWVEIAGVRGATVKHSVELWSLEPGTPIAESPLKSARKQYRPAEVTVATG